MNKLTQNFEHTIIVVLESQIGKIDNFEIVQFPSHSIPCNHVTVRFTQFGTGLSNRELLKDLYLSNDHEIEDLPDGTSFKILVRTTDIRIYRRDLYTHAFPLHTINLVVDAKIDSSSYKPIFDEHHALLYFYQ